MSALTLTTNLAISIVASLPLGVFLVSRKGEVVYANSKAENIFAYNEDELTGLLIEELVPEKHRVSHVKHRTNYTARPINTPMSGGRMLVGIKKNGEEISLQIGLTPLSDEHTLVSFIESTNEIIKPSSSNDPLTGLANRQRFSEYGLKLCNLALRNNDSLSILFIDIDNFKLVNDQCGHDVGDLVICEIANMLKNSIRGGDLVARVGGDEFVMCLYGVKSLMNLQTLSEMLINKISALKNIKGNVINIGASVGAVTTRTKENMKINGMIELADKLMYEAKGSGKGSAVVKEV